MDDTRRGFGYGVGAYLIWGTFPLYWPLLKPSGVVEILAHRVLWTLGVIAILLAVTRNWRWIATLVRRPRTIALLCVAAVLIGLNWGTYIWGVNHGHVVETSLGYFINPLFTVALGVVVLGERLRPGQWLAVLVGAVAVIVLGHDYGRVPWIAVCLAVTFGLYGLAKKTVGIGAVESLAVETIVLVVPAAAYLGWLVAAGQSTFGAVSAGHSLVMTTTGLAGALPLLFFGAAARRLPLAVIGMVQYLAPVLQFAIGVLVMGEPMPGARLAGFVMVWSALVILTVEGLVHRSRNKNGGRRAVNAAAAATPCLHPVN